MQDLLYRTRTIIASQRFFQSIIVVSVVSATWIALTGHYPMAFDEDFHLGLIRVYASHSLPFFSNQPANADAYGAVARDPSFLYHYIMSFPYRLICLFTQNEHLQVLILRALNIALFTSCLPLFRQLLRRAGASAALAHTCLALFVLIPITPLMAAQINYDNAVLPLTAWLLLLALETRATLGREKILILMKIMVIGLTGSLIKFAFLPIFLAVVAWLFFQLKPWRMRSKPAVKELLDTFRTRTGGVLLGLIIVLSLFGLNRYGVNVIRYHDPIPDCGKVLSLDHCKYYGPYIRDYNFSLNKTNYNTSLYEFSKEWLYGMWLRSTFAVDGPATQFQTRGPLFIPAITAIILPLLGVGAFLWRGRQLLRSNRASSSLFIAVSTIYVGALWLQEYKLFKHTGLPVAINGRYLLLIILLAMFVFGQALSLGLGRLTYLKTGLATLSIIAMLWGGGALTYILRSSDAWYWNGGVIKAANHGVQHTIGPVTPGYYRPNAFLR
ncbi:hypothetical protein H7Y63_04030 [Polaromonas sp.]|nr:hypothetical protein [Candidatus Saccharibacteria bacterium]